MRKAGAATLRVDDERARHVVDCAEEEVVSSGWRREGLRSGAGAEAGFAVGEPGHAEGEVMFDAFIVVLHGRGDRGAGRHTYRFPVKGQVIGAESK